VGDALDDDLHLNQHHAKLLAESINSRLEWYLGEGGRTQRKEPQRKEPQAERREPRRSPAEHEAHATLEAEECDIKEVMGRQHSRITEIEERHGVRIRASKEAPGKIIVWGPERRVHQAENEVRDKLREIYERRDTNTRRREERANTQCWFYLQGRCQKGRRCFFSHEDPQRRITERERSRSREDTRERREVRNKSAERRPVRSRSAERGNGTRDGEGRRDGVPRPRVVRMVWHE
jgi:hypothetical protein